MANIKHYESKDGKLKYDLNMDRPDANELNKGRVFLNKEEQDTMIPYLHDDDDYPQRQMRTLKRGDRNVISSCDYDNSVIVWKNKSDKEVDPNPLTATAIGFNSKGEKVKGEINKPDNSSCEKNIIWDPKRIIDGDDDDNQKLDSTRTKEIYGLEEKFPDLRRLIHVDIYLKPTNKAKDLKETLVTNVDTMLKAIDMSQIVLLAWGGPIIWDGHKRKQLEKLENKLKELADEGKVFWFGEISNGQPAHATASPKGRGLKAIPSAYVENIFNNKPSTL